MNNASRLLQRLKAAARARTEAAQIAAGDPYADLEEAAFEERQRGEHFDRDGVRRVGPHPSLDALEEGGRRDR
jgi:hypothetical protein